MLHRTERIQGTQATLFDELPNGQKLLFNGLPGKKSKPQFNQASLLETVADEIERQQVAPIVGQSRLF